MTRRLLLMLMVLFLGGCVLDIGGLRAWDEPRGTWSEQQHMTWGV